MMPYTRRQSLLLPAVPLIVSSGLARAAEVNPAAVALLIVGKGPATTTPAEVK